MTTPPDTALEPTPVAPLVRFAGLRFYTVWLRFGALGALASMRFQPLIIAAIFGLAVHRAVAEPTLTNTVGIYLFADSEDWQESASNWTSRALSPTPVISEADILTYKFTTHFMTLTPEAAQRISNFRIRRLTEPFVVVVNGERIYRGVFVSSLCSQSIELPSITLWGSQTFTWYTNLFTNLPPNSLFIARTYAAPSTETEPDPRSDDRLKRVLEILHKLK